VLGSRHQPFVCMLLGFDGGVALAERGGSELRGACPTARSGTPSSLAACQEADVQERTEVVTMFAVRCRSFGRAMRMRAYKSSESDSAFRDAGSRMIAGSMNPFVIVPVRFA